MAEIRSVGIPSPRVEGEEKVGGKARYAGDVVLPNS
jgi:CO/xanthine dehydrogenase Mo-binding subunit